MTTSDENLLKSLPEDLFSPTYNNDISYVEGNRIKDVEFQEDSCGRDKYMEDISPYFAQALLSPGDFDPNAEYKLMQDESESVLVKIKRRNDDKKSIDKVEEFLLESEDEVQSLHDVLQDMHGNMGMIKKSDAHVHRTVSEVRNYTWFYVTIFLLLLLAGVMLILICLK